MNGYDRLRRCTEERRSKPIGRYLSATVTVLRRLVNRARILYRRPTRPPPADSNNHELPDVLSLGLSCGQQTLA